MKRAAFVWLVGAGVAGAAIVLSRPWSRVPAPAPADAATAGVAFELACAPGQVDELDLTWKSTGRVEASPDRTVLVPSGEGASTKEATMRVGTDIASKVWLTCVGRGEGGTRDYVIRATSLEGSLTLGTNELPIPEETERALEQGFGVKVGADGRVLSITLDPLADRIARTFARQVAGIFQVVGAKGSATTWQTNEEDALGSFHATYTLLPEPGDAPGTRMVRKALEGRDTARMARSPYERLRATGGRQRVEQAVFELDEREGLLRECAGAFVAEVTLGTRVVSSDETAFHLHWAGRRSLDAGVAAVPHGVEEPFGLGAIQKEARQRENAAIIAATDLRGMLDDAKKNPPGVVTEEQATLGRILEAFFESAPDSLALAETHLLARDAKEHLFAQIVGALSRTGGERTQALLVKVLRALPIDHPGRSVLLVGLGRASEVHDETVRALWDLTEHPRAKDDQSTALLMLGAAAGEIEGTSAPRSYAIVERLLGLHAKAKAPSVPAGERILLLRALGNSASPRALDRLIEDCDATDDGVREAAIDALRFETSPNAVARLTQAAKEDASPMVRRSAIVTIALRPTTPELVALLADRIDRDPDAEVRHAAYSELDQCCPADEGACRALAALRADGSAEAKKTMAKWRPPVR